MKTIIILCLFIILTLTVIPLSSSFNMPEKKIIPTLARQEKNIEKSETFKIKSVSDGKITEYSAAEYITGVLCAEVPYTYNKEALKAQAVAAYTFALKRKSAAKNDYDLTDSPKTDQCFLTEEALKEKWGENFEAGYNIMKTAAKEVEGEFLSYDGAPALTVYHAVSSGRTANAKDVWGGNYPYLVSVDSIGDKLAPNYLSTVVMGEDELKEKLSSLCKTEKGGNLFGKSELFENDCVKSIEYAQKSLTGDEIRNALSLNSSAFTAEYKNGEYTFTVKGKGHGVGMSQNGANYMAQQGSDYEEILLHYYTGCVLEKNS